MGSARFCRIPAGSARPDKRKNDCLSIHSYFPTWTTDAKGCGAGSGRIYGLTFDSCQAAMPDPYDDEHTVSFVSVNNYPSTIALSDQGTLLYPGLPSSSAPVSVVDVHDPLHGTALLSYALLNP